MKSTFLRHWIAIGVTFLRAREPVMLVGMLLIVTGIWGFVELADEVVDGTTGNFDRWAILQLRSVHDSAIPVGPGWLAEVGRDITGLGGVAVLSLFIAAASGFLVIHHAYRTTVVLLISTTSGIAISLLLKNAFDRPRPDVVPHLAAVYSSSFPSGHSMMSAVVYLTLAAIVAPVLKHFWVRVYILACAGIVVALIGVSRVYMGVHYPTDVLAGWTAGLVWAIACWLITRPKTAKRIESVDRSELSESDAHA